MMSENNAIFSLKDVHKAFGREVVLRGVDLNIQPDSTTVVLGPSGCGKSVLLKLMIGLLKPERGNIFFTGQDVTALNETQLAPLRKRMGFLFQGSALFDSMTLAQNVCFPLEQHGIGDAAYRRKRCEEVIDMVGLTGLNNRLPGELSGGQQKRAALARAIAMEPEIIFYDEPTTGLDPIRAEVINDLIIRLRNQLNNTAVVVTHDLHSAKKIGDRLLMLHHGKFILDTTPENLEDSTDKRVQRFLAGQSDSDEPLSGQAVENL